ncbi:NAD(P)H-hydrate dehydratase [Candidatus Nitrosacidococcus tergens]|uniref:Bifunctional NAD(P)H-hydrate repair enzyme n=1 Tax=Candidatus Nitrosacidococcus tergens TaxID=553981 RepID=A0A7G1Q8E6_9GAMM|nr:NAD(P)H-hydrate dehydratase [Candidatus Nitrosacidococcus tergens]CAB1274684.1 putative carbohydrate kinase [Candidatus Nitrosacidococcus tergens]
MEFLPFALYQVHQVRQLDQYAIEQLKIPSITLMERAGIVALKQLRKHWPYARRIVVVCGSGNNGGDGYILARLAHQIGLHIILCQIGDGSKLNADALQAKQSFINRKIPILPFHPQYLKYSDIIVDAIFGTGINREITGIWAEAIHGINNSGHPVLSIDIPSGLCGDTGNILGVAVKAHLTVSLVGLKQGMFTYLGPDYCGKISFNSLQLPDSTYKSITPKVYRLNFRKELPILPSRILSGYKSSYGHVLIIGGEEGMSGAVRMAGEAAYRVGAGLVSIATRKSHATLLNLTRPELMCHGVENKEQLKPLLDKATVIVIGPGLGQSAWSQMMLHEVLNAASRPLIIDADALNLLAKNPVKHSHWVITPHPGEAGRLLSKSTLEIQQDRFTAVRTLQQRYGGVSILKGNGTLVCEENQPLGLSTAGNPGMATGGMGDVLSGVIGGLLAQGLTLIEAARLGVLLHGTAGDQVAQTHGERGLMAGDLMPYLQHLVNLKIMDESHYQSSD